MLTAACAIIALALLGAAVLSGYVVGHARKLRTGEGHLLGRAAGIRIGRAEGQRERDELADQLDDATAEYVATLSKLAGIARERDGLREQLAEVKDTLDATMRNFEDYVTDHANTYPPTTWSDAVPPGGQVCAVPDDDKPGEICGMPVESEPCPVHTCACYRTVDAIFGDAREVTR